VSKILWIFRYAQNDNGDFSLSIESSKRQSLLIVNVVLILLGYNGVKFDKKVCQKAILKGKVTLMSF